LEVNHLGRVRRTRTELEDPGVATRTLGVTRGDLVEQLVDDALVGVLEDRHRLPARVQVALARQRDQLLDLRLDRLGLGLGGLDPLVVDDLDAEVRQQRLAVRGVAGELVAGLLVAHQSVRRVRPRCESVSMTSSIDFLPKFGIAASSPSDLETRSPTVWIPARLRQLYERTPSSSSSMRMSSIGLPPARPPGAASAPEPAPLSPSAAMPPGPARRSSMRSSSVKIASEEIRI